MGNAYLKPIYRRIYHKDFSYDSFDQRLEMQKAVYLLQEMGASIGDYAFFWYKHGPYSQDLQDAMHDVCYSTAGNTTSEIAFSKDTDLIIKSVGDMLNQSVVYSRKDWAECLASLHYLKTRIYPAFSKNELITELEKRKPHLSNRKANEKAYDLVADLCA